MSAFVNVSEKQTCRVCFLVCRTSFNLKFMDAVPDGVDCRSLRRSFNQNNIRNGMSREDTSILSGHSVTVNAKHYARKEAKEIDLE